MQFETQFPNVIIAFSAWYEVDMAGGPFSGLEAKSGLEAETRRFPILVCGTAVLFEQVRCVRGVRGPLRPTGDPSPTVDEFKNCVSMGDVWFCFRHNFFKNLSPGPKKIV
jgi:hypothetical protein